MDTMECLLPDSELGLFLRCRIIATFFFYNFPLVAQGSRNIVPGCVLAQQGKEESEHTLQAFPGTGRSLAMD